MKTKSILIAVLSFVLVAGTFAKDKNEKVVFSVDMDCPACQQKIEKNIAFEKGVKDLEVDLENDLVTVTYKSSKTDIAKLQKGFEKIGYKAVELKAKGCCSEEASTECKEKCADDKKATTDCESKECASKSKQVKK